MRQVVPPDELQTIVSNIGVMPDLSSLFTPNSGMHTAFVQVGLEAGSQGEQLRLHGRRARPHWRANFLSCARTFSRAAWWTRC